MLQLLCLVASFEDQKKKSNLNYSKHFLKICYTNYPILY